MPRLLAIDTSTEACSVALLDGATIIERFIDAPREHMQRLLPMIDELLSERRLTLRDLDAIAFARGPGSFTGLRICLGVVQGLAFGAQLPVIPVSTLAVLAQTAVTSTLVCGTYLLSAIDARMDEVYCSWFELGDDGLVIARSDEIVCAPEAIPQLPTVNHCIGIGSGWNYGVRLPQQNFVSIDAALLPRASALLRLALPLWEAGVRVPAEQALPVYLRDNVAWKK